MKIAMPDPGPSRDERELIADLPLPPAARALELGCGTARQTRALAASGKFGAITACEVDERQHALNLDLHLPLNPGLNSGLNLGLISGLGSDPNTGQSDPPAVTFALGGAERIPFDDASVDAVFLFKSLHHVPGALLDQAFGEMRRVLKPGGLLYISEPIFAGDYNDIIRLFHDERTVRQAAFDATRRAVEGGVFDLVSQTFFLAPVRHRSFADFERAVIGVTHTAHQLSAALHQQVRARFEAHMTADGAFFQAPFRVDLLRRPTA